MLRVPMRLNPSTLFFPFLCFCPFEARMNADNRVRRFVTVLRPYRTTAVPVLYGVPVYSD